MACALRVLIVEDNDDDRVLIEAALRRGRQEIVCRCVASAAQLHSALDQDAWDVVISDYAMPGFSGIEALRIVVERSPGQPFIIFSGAIGEDTAVQMMKGGAHDFVGKGSPARLLPAVERALADNAARLEEAFEQAVFGLAQVGGDGRLLRMNRKFRELLGYERDEVSGLAYHDVIAVNAGAGAMGAGAVGAGTMGAVQGAALHRELEEGLRENYALEKCYRRKDGSTGWIALNVSMERTVQDEALYRMEVIEEISARRRAGAELLRNKLEIQAINARLQVVQGQLQQTEKMASIGQLAAGVAHEINNPIAYVSSNLGSLEKYLQQLFAMLAAHESVEATLAPAARDALRALRNEIDLDFLRGDIGLLMGQTREGIARVGKIVHDLKDFSRSGAPDEWCWADLHRGMDFALNIADSQLRYKCEIRREYGVLPEIECLPSQLNQVFLNLLVNAGHAIEARGTVTVRSGMIGADTVWVEVADTGKGMDAASRSRIFDPFFTTKAMGKGTGLGLSLSYGIVQKHNGSIEVDSVPGRGSTFRVILPVRHCAVAAPAARVA